MCKADIDFAGSLHIWTRRGMFGRIYKGFLIIAPWCQKRYIRDIIRVNTLIFIQLNFHFWMTLLSVLLIE